MDAVRALADTNVKVSEARVSLFKIMEQEASYIAEREKKALEAVDKALADSASTIAEAKENYARVMVLVSTVSEFADFLKKSQELFSSTVSDFEEHVILWESEAEERRKSLESFAQAIKDDKVRIKNDSESLDRGFVELAQGKKLLLDRQGVLDRSITRLKENRK